MNYRKLTWMAALIALTVVGGSIKIPSAIGSIAFDSMPALVAAALFGGVQGAVVGGVGHLVSAYLGGLPLGPFHLLIALEMAALCWTFGVLYEKGRTRGAVLLFVMGNTLIAPLPFIYFISKAFYFSVIPSLLVASILNTILAVLIAPRLEPILKLRTVGVKR